MNAVSGCAASARLPRAAHRHSTGTGLNRLQLFSLPLPHAAAEQPLLPHEKRITRHFDDGASRTQAQAVHRRREAHQSEPGHPGPHLPRDGRAIRVGWGIDAFARFPRARDQHPRDADDYNTGAEANANPEQAVSRAKHRAGEA